MPLGSGESLRAAASGSRLFGTETRILEQSRVQDRVLLAFAAGEEINERDGDCGCLDDADEDRNEDTSHSGTGQADRYGPGP